MNTIFTNLIHDKSWAYITTSAGVYCFYNIKEERFAYIGSTSNLRERIKSHMGIGEGPWLKKPHGMLYKQIQQKPECFTFFFTAYIGDYSKYEIQLIQKYQPMYNRRDIKRPSCPGFGDMSYDEWQVKNKEWQKQFQIKKDFCVSCIKYTDSIPWDSMVCTICGNYNERVKDEITNPPPMSGLDYALSNKINYEKLAEYRLERFFWK